MYKAVKNCGRIVEFAKQDEKTLMRWAAGILAREGRKITTRDMELFLTKTGTDMGNIRMELEKLITYTMGQDIVTREDIEEICTTRTENKIFDMVLAKKMAGEGASQNEIATRLGVPSFVARNILACARAYSVEELEQAEEDFVDAEEAVKTGRLQDVLSVELLIVKYSTERKR
jgi:DNA polymerase-3 subunit delta